MLPQLNVKQDRTDFINAFGGLNKNFKINDGEFSETFNMTNDYYPVLANRSKRGIIKTLTKPQALIGGKYLSYVDDGNLYYNDQFVIDLKLNSQSREVEIDKKRQLVMMGALLCVFPDGVIYNTYDETISYMKNEVTTSTPPTFNLVKLDGTKFDTTNTVTSSTAPTDTSKYWIDTSTDNVVIKIYSASSSAWVSVGTTYIKIESEGIGEGFKAYDAALISGVDESTAIYNNLEINTTNIIYDAGDDYIVIAGLINQTFTNTTNITVKRELPEMDFVCELDNRIWGCSSDNHEIYACKLGDPTNWKCYAGLDSDSYAATIGTENDFTGCIAYSGYVFFFKENGFHRIYGTKPSNYEINWKPCRGIQKGCEKSLAIINEVLIYKARDAVCIYDGTVDKISEKIDSVTYYAAVSGVYRDKYYISMRDAEYNYFLFVYDTSKGLWIQEDDIELIYAANAEGGLYLVDKNFNLKLINVEKMKVKKFPELTVFPSADLFPGNSENGVQEDEVLWSFTTGDLGEDSPYSKYVKRIDLRMWLDISAYMRIQVMYDNSNQWLNVMEYYANKKKSFSLPIPVQRCDHFKLKISGKGDFKLYSISKVIEDGTDAGGASNA